MTTFREVYFLRQKSEALSKFAAFYEGQRGTSAVSIGRGLYALMVMYFGVTSLMIIEKPMT
jgi:hypothetical protein